MNASDIGRGYQESAGPKEALPIGVALRYPVVEDLLESKFWVISDRMYFPGATPAGEPRALFIDGARIGASASAQELREGPLREAALSRGIEVRDEGRRPVVPSFVNGHTHLALTALRGITSLSARSGNVVSDVFFRLESHMTPADVRAFTKLGAFESLLSGVGRVWDHFYFGDELAEALSEVGMTGVVCPTLQDRSGPGADATELQLEASMRIASSERFSGCGIDGGLGPHASDTVSIELMNRVGEVAREKNLPVHLHLAQASEEMRAAGEVDSLAGVVSDALRDCSVLMAHGLYLDEQSIARLVGAKWSLAYCPYSQLQFGFLSPISAWRRAGGRFCVGTDCVASNDAWDVQRELPIVAGEAALAASFSSPRGAFLRGEASVAEVEAARKEFLAGGGAVPTEELFRVATSDPLGERAPLSVGALANFLVLDPDHPSLFPSEELSRALVYGQTSGAILWSSTGGQIRGATDGLSREVLRSGEYLDVLSETRRRRDELFERAKMPAVLSTS